MMNALLVMLRLGFNAYAKDVFMLIQVRMVLQMYYKQDIQTGTTNYIRNNQSTKHLEYLQHLGANNLPLFVFVVPKLPLQVSSLDV